MGKDQKAVKAVRKGFYIVKLFYNNILNPMFKLTWDFYVEYLRGLRKYIILT